MKSELSRDLGRTIAHLNRLRRRFMADRLRDEGVGGSLYLFLLTLDRNPGTSQDQLALWFFMDKGNIARSAKKLEELEYIRREVSPDDRRQYMLYLTDKGERLLPVIRTHLAEWSEFITSGFTEEETKAAVALLGRMEENCGNRTTD